MKKFTTEDCYRIQNNPLTASKILDYIPLQEDEYLHLLYNINFNIIDKSYGHDNGLAGFNIVSNGEEITMLNYSEEYRVVETDDGLKLLIIRVHGTANGVKHYRNLDLVDMYSIFIIEKEITHISSQGNQIRINNPLITNRAAYGVRDIRRVENAQTDIVKELRGLENPTPIEKYILNIVTTREYRLPRTVIIVDKMDYKSILIAAVLNTMYGKYSSYKEKVHITSTDEVLGFEDEIFILNKTDAIISTTASITRPVMEVYDIDTAISFVNQLQNSLYTVGILDSDRINSICSNILDRYLVKDNVTRDNITIDVISHLTGSYKEILEVFTKMIEIASRNEGEICIDFEGTLTERGKDVLNTVVDDVIKTIDTFKNDNTDSSVISLNEGAKDAVIFKVFETYLPITSLKILLITIRRLNLFKDENCIMYNYATTEYGCIHSSVVSWLTPETVETVKSGVDVENVYTYLDKHLNSKLKGVPTTEMDRHIDGDMEVISTYRVYKLSDVLNNDSSRNVHYTDM